MSQPAASPPPADEELSLPWLEQLLVPLHDAGPVDEPKRKAARDTAAQGQIVLGSAIDPQSAITSLNDFVTALRLDPGCVPALQGVSKALLTVVRARPAEAEAVLTVAIRWLNRGFATVGSLQSQPEAHEIEARLREVRREVLARPKATGRAVRVKLERDAEGRVQGQQPLRMMLDSAELRALLPGAPAAPDETGTPLSAWIYAVAALLLVMGLTGAVQGQSAILTGGLVGLGLSALFLPVLVWLGQRTAGIAPPVIAVVLIGGSITLIALARGDVSLSQKPWESGLGDLYAGMQQRLVLPEQPPTVSPLPTPLAIVREAPNRRRPLRRDRLHARLPAALRAETTAPGTLVVLRRLKSDAGPALVLWLVDPTNGEVLGTVPLTGSKQAALEERALALLERLATAKPSDE